MNKFLKGLVILAAAFLAPINGASAQEQKDFDHLTLRAGCQKLKDVFDEMSCKKSADGLRWSQERISRMKTPKETTEAAELYAKNKEAFIKDFRGVWATSSK